MAAILSCERWAQSSLLVIPHSWDILKKNIMQLFQALITLLTAAMIYSAVPL